jgi:uncharacterized alkaline shock family protein YloU
MFCLLGLYGCGIEVTVNHKIQIDLNSLNEYFRNICEGEQSTNIDLCIDNKVTNFLNLVL